MDPAQLSLFSYFTGGGEEGVRLACSVDGLAWTPLDGGEPLLRPYVGSKLMRDPAIALGPDGLFHMVWTSGWFDCGIGLAHSADLTNWSRQEFVEVMHDEPGAVNCWAPELFYDDASGEFIVYWSSTVPGKFPDTDGSGDLHDGHQLNHRVYFATTRDFTKFSETRLLYDGGFNTIDATITRVGDRHVMILKDETRHPHAVKSLRIATSEFATGPYGPASGPISPPWVEGPSVLRSGECWLVFYDEYTRDRYGAICSTDLVEWRVVSHRVQFPPGARHGSVLACSPAHLPFAFRP
jgi:hypothetical protein